MVNKKLNCWEVKRCGREPGGAKASEKGVCPSTTETRLDGVHGGQNAGRACWAVAGTLCGGTVQGEFATKYNNCRVCDFYQMVVEEEGFALQLSMNLMARLKTPLNKVA